MKSSEWLLLAFSLATEPAYLRVKVWRRLQAVGAVSYRNGLYVLPANESTVEDFEWILREIRAGGGDGAIFESRLIGGAADEVLRSLFNSAREEDYRSLADELRDIAGARAKRERDVGGADRSADLARVRKRLAHIEQIDFFNANGRQSVAALLAKLETRLTAHEETPPMSSAPKAALRNRKWVTRAHVQVDRMASAWLIKRFIDPQATFGFTTERNYQPQPDEVRFDMYEAEYTHDAERCTFEVLLDLIQEADPALRAIAEIVHDLDLKDDKFHREETAGVKRLLDGITASYERDAERLERSTHLFDDLHRSF